MSLSYLEKMHKLTGNVNKLCAVLPVHWAPAGGPKDFEDLPRPAASTQQRPVTGVPGHTYPTLQGGPRSFVAENTVHFLHSPTKSVTRLHVLGEAQDEISRLLPGVRKQITATSSRDGIPCCHLSTK